MVNVTLFKSSQKKEWDNFVEKCKIPLFFFRRDYLEYHSDRFIDHSLMFYSNETLIAILPATKHENEIRSHGGLTFGGLLIPKKTRIETVIEIFHLINNYLKGLGVDKLVYKPAPSIFHQYPSQEDLYCISNILDGKLVRRDLSSIIFLKDRIKLSKGRKALISKARKQGVVVVNSNDWTRFYTLLNHVLEKHSATSVHTAEELEYLANLYPDNIKLKVVFIDGEMVAGVLMFIFNDIVHTQYMATNDIGRINGALDYIVETCITEAQNLGQNYFSFGISTENNGKILNGGLAAQKESFGARAICLDGYEIDIK